MISVSSFTTPLPLFILCLIATTCLLVRHSQWASRQWQLLLPFLTSFVICLLVPSGPEWEASEQTGYSGEEEKQAQRVLSGGHMTKGRPLNRCPAMLTLDANPACHEEGQVSQGWRMNFTLRYAALLLYWSTGGRGETKWTRSNSSAWPSDQLASLVFLQWSCFFMVSLEGFIHICLLCLICYCTVPWALEKHLTSYLNRSVMYQWHFDTTNRYEIVIIGFLYIYYCWCSCC